MDKRSGRTSSNGGKRSVNPKRPVPRNRTSSETRKINTISDETKKYNFDEDELKKASTKVKKGTKKNVKNKNKNKKKKLAWSIIKKILLAILILGILAGLIVAGILAGIFFGFFGSDFKMTKSDLTIQFVNSEVYDADGKLICSLNGNEKRKLVSLEQMPEYLPKAYVAIEDERFYEHNGVDIKRTGAATVTYVLHGGKSSFGGSTITQQLVKNITDDDEDSALRKVKEMARAIQVEKEISKDDILELYLNIIFVGGNNINGVELGAEYYFNKDVSQVTIAEAAFMAGINHTPNSYNPYIGTEEEKAAHIENGKKRTKVVLNKMLELGYISQEEFDTANAEVDKGLPFSQGALTSNVILTAHTEAALNEIVEQMMAEKGMTRDMAESKLYGSGYKIYTTQVTSIQNTMQEEMSKDKYIMPGKVKLADNVTLKNDQSQAAMVVIEPSTGKVVGCVGKLGAKTTNGDLNRATQTKRQIGSAMKPIAVIGPAVQEGIISPASVYDDKQTSEFSVDGKPWPKNYYGSFYGKQTVREAIKISGNVIPVRILNQIGVSKSIEYLNKMNMTVQSPGLSLALGSAEFTPLQMAAAYATIANDGTYIQPTFYSKVVDLDGNVVIEPHQTKTEVFGKSESYIIKSIITEPVVGVGTPATHGRGGTATYCKIPGMDVCAKTGTTDDDYDRWLCGFTSYYAAACWYGYDQNEEVKYTKASPTNPAGGIWSAVMKSIHTGLEPKTFVKPDDVVQATVCHDSGLLPSAGCTNVVTDWFIQSKVPTERCGTQNFDKEYAICEESGMLAVEGACPKIVTKRASELETVPTQSCTIHKVPEATPTPSATPTTPVTSPSTKPSTKPSEKPTGSPSPSVPVSPSASTHPSVSPSTQPSTSPSAPVEKKNE